MAGRVSIQPAALCQQGSTLLGNTPGHNRQRLPGVIVECRLTYPVHVHVCGALATAPDHYGQLQTTGLHDLFVKVVLIVTRFWQLWETRAAHPELACRCNNFTLDSLFSLSSFIRQRWRPACYRRSCQPVRDQEAPCTSLLTVFKETWQHRLWPAAAPSLEVLLHSRLQAATCCRCGGAASTWAAAVCC
jgi:hypothetical protein